MTAAQSRSTATTSLGGALVALAGLLALVAMLGTGEYSGLLPIGTILLALGTLVLAVGLGGVSVVGPSRVGRVALVIFGVGPLTYLLQRAPEPWSLLVGMSAMVLVTIATVVIAVSVARARTLGGVARWVLVVVAIDALLTAVMSSVQLGDLPLVSLAWHLELVRPIALLIWGVSIALHGRGPAIQRRSAALVDAWRRSTDVGGGTAEADTASGSRIRSVTRTSGRI